MIKLKKKAARKRSGQRIIVIPKVTERIEKGTS